MNNENGYIVQHLEKQSSASTEESAEVTNWIKNCGLNKISYPNGDTFEGVFSDDRVKDGSGTYQWKIPVEGDADSLEEVARFEGQYCKGVKCGFGKMKFPNGDTYEGNWRDGKMHGEGTYVYSPTGDIYSGLWSDGKRHGEGTYEYDKDKSVLVGTWHQGDFEVGDWIMTSQITYSGKFRSGRPFGNGKFILATGSTIEGTFQQKSLDSDDQTPCPVWCSTSVPQI